MAHERRPALKVNRQLAERFGIDSDRPDPPREMVKVDSLPDPPRTIEPVAESASASAGPVTVATAAAQSPSPSPSPLPIDLDLEETILHILAEEMDELAARLAPFNISLDTSARQQLVDTAMALLAGAVRAGGAISGH